MVDTQRMDYSVMLFVIVLNTMFNLYILLNRKQVNLT